MLVRKIAVVTFVFLLSFLFICSICLADTIKLGVVTKRGAAQNVCAEKFKNLIEKKTKYKIKIYDDASLGSETEILKILQKGEIQIAIVTSGPFDEFVPEARVVDYPFLFQNYQQVDAVLDGEPGRRLLKSLEKAGFKGLAFAENGFRHITANKPIRSVDDVAGLRIRVMQSVIHQEIWKSLKAEPVVLGWPINKELREKTIDAQENPLSVILVYKINELQKHLALTGHVYSAHIAAANLDWFQSLTVDDQAAIESAMKTAAKWERKWNRENEAHFLQKLKKAGMAVNEKPDRASFQQKLSSFGENYIFKDEATARLLKVFMEAAR